MKDLGKFVEEERIQIPWSKISNLMGKRSRLSCFKKWQKMTGLYGPLDEFKRAADGEAKSPEAKRLKTSSSDTAPTAGAAAAAAISGKEYDEDNSAKMAAETVEALELPDTSALGNTTTATETV